MIFGPTFEEMLHPETLPPEFRLKVNRAYAESPLDPINLFNITWRNHKNMVHHIVLPSALTGVDTPIVLLRGERFPSGSHKVGASYSVLLEKILLNEVDPKAHTLVFPSTGNYGIGGAWVGGRMGCDSLVVLPEEMSQERFDRIEAYGAGVIKTAGSESNVKEIYDETKRLGADDPNIRILNQFDEMGNYRFHYHVTGNTIVELAGELHQRGVGSGKISAFVSSMGSAGTIAAGDRLKQVWTDCKVVGLEPIQCPTLFNNGYGSHDIQGIGDKHVTWIHNVWGMDALICIDDLQCKKGLQVLAEEVACETLHQRYGIDPELIQNLQRSLGISGICNILGAIKTAKYYKMGADDLIVTVATDGMDRYHSVMQAMAEKFGVLDESATVGRIESVFYSATTDWILEGTESVRERWHNLKYFTWVEQQGKTVAALDAQRDSQWWIGHQQQIAYIDEKLKQQRELL